MERRASDTLISESRAAAGPRPSVALARRVIIQRVQSQVGAYAKTSPNRSDRILAVVYPDPHHPQPGFVDAPVDEPGCAVTDFSDDTTYT